MATIQQELWLSEIQENIFKGLEAISVAGTNDSAFVNGVTIHIPNAGTAATVTKGNSTYPVATSTRTDNDNTYNLTNYEMGPLRLGWVEQLQLNYDKEKSLINDLVGGISERVARELMISWYHYTSGAYVTTTGSNYTAHAPSATSTRKGLTGADLRAAAGILDKQLIPMSERYLLVDSIMFWQLMDDLEYNADRVGVLGNGLQTAPGTPYGFTVIQMPAVVYATSAGVVNAYGAAGATTDQAVALALQKSAVSWALTGTEMFESVDRDAANFGKLISASVYGGGKYRRYDKKGVVPIIQANGA